MGGSAREWLPTSPQRNLREDACQCVGAGTRGSCLPVTRQAHLHLERRAPENNNVRSAKWPGSWLVLSLCSPCVEGRAMWGPAWYDAGSFNGLDSPPKLTSGDRIAWGASDCPRLGLCWSRRWIDTSPADEAPLTWTTKDTSFYNIRPAMHGSFTTSGHAWVYAPGPPNRVLGYLAWRVVDFLRAVLQRGRRRGPGCLNSPFNGQE